MPNKISEIFKPHIAVSRQYVGGSTRKDSVADNKRKLYKLSSNENMLGASPKALKAIHKNLSQLNEYNYENDQVFRQALTGHFKEKALPEQFITANSGMELLELICRGFAGPGTECILSSPTFMAYQNFALTEGSAVIDVPLKKGSFELDIDGILKAVNDKTRILFLTNPNNPTGSFIPKSITDRLIKKLPGHMVVVYDEVYFHYVQEAGYARAIDYIQQHKNVIGLHSFSKAYGMAGLRLGYAFTTPEIAGYLNKIRRPFMINTLSMEAGLAALKDKPHLKRTIGLVEREKQWLYEHLDLLLIHYWKSAANFILFRSPIATALLAEQLLEEGVMVRTGEVFLADGCIRVTIGTREANEAFVDGMKKIVRDAGRGI